MIFTISYSLYVFPLFSYPILWQDCPDEQIKITRIWHETKNLFSKRSGEYSNLQQAPRLQWELKKKKFWPRWVLFKLKCCVGVNNFIMFILYCYYNWDRDDGPSSLPDWLLFSFSQLLTVHVTLRPFPPCMEPEPVKYRDAVCPSCHNWKLCYSTGVQLIAIWPSTDRPQDKKP